MSVLTIVLLVLAALLVLLFVGGYLANRRRFYADREAHARRIAEADQALEAARAADRGWERAELERAARAALEAERPEFRYDELALVLVDDRPGVEEDRAHFLASGREGEVRVLLARRDGGWTAEQVG